METRFGSPFRGEALERLRLFLAENGLRYEDDVEYTVVLQEAGRLLATGSLAGSVIKCLCVAAGSQGEGLAATVVSALAAEAARRGRVHLFLYTKPVNERLFSALGFYPVATLPEALLMENRKNGVRDFVESVRQPAVGRVGCIVANCNPFTLGHRYLAETAAARCDFLYFFLLSEERGMFTPARRMAMAKAGTADIKNLAVVPTGPYMVSSATFPAYFLPDGADPAAVHGTLDLAVFCTHFAGPLGIGRRFVGSEPYSATTAAYNRQMHADLPRCGVEVVELPRLEADGAAVSASRVRALLAAGALGEARRLVPETTFRALEEMKEAEVPHGENGGECRP